MLSRLNPQQRKAVETIHCPLLVLAGAGSGKTSVITRKIAHLIETCDFKAHQILAVTFTNKAAREMKERVNKLLSKDKTRGLRVSTFHNFGLKFCQAELKLLDLKPGFSIFDDQDASTLLKDITNKDVETNKEELRTLQSKISEWKNELIQPEQALTTAKDAEDVAAAKLYQHYQRALHAYNALDFDDLIMRPTLLLRDNDECLVRWQSKIHYFLVDEYQDTNTSQYEFIRLLVGKRGKLTVVGDDDQSIYAWRGARPENLEALNQDYPQLEVIKLEQNYRSVGRVLKAANTLIANNPHLFEKRLWSEKPFGEPIRVLSTRNEEAEAQRIVSEIIQHKFSGHRDYRDFAILYRSNHQSRLLEKFFAEHNIPYKLSGGTSFFSRTEIKDIMAYMRLLSNPDDDSAFLRIVNVPRRSIGTATLEKLGRYATRRNISLFAASFELGLEQELSERALENLQAFTRLIVETADNIQRGDATQVLGDFLNQLDYHEWLYEQNTNPKAADYKYQNVKELERWIHQRLEDDISFKEVISGLVLRDILEQQDKDEQVNAVHLLTLHAAKGLEFPHVYIIGMEEEILPHKNSIEIDSIEEERRLAYVGITRAQISLTFSVVEKRARYGELATTEPSRFLYELPEGDLEWEKPREKMSDDEKQETSRSNIQNLRAMLSSPEDHSERDS
ncbi:MAG: DNA helicase Rep [Pseudomonadota bacterium]